MTADDTRAESPHPAAYHPEHLYSEDQPSSEDEIARDRRQRVLRVVALVLLIIAGIVVLLLAQCGGENLPSDQSIDRSIGGVENQQPYPGAVSVWVKSDTRIAMVIQAAGVHVTDRLDLGNGRYVLSVPEGTEEFTVSALKAMDGVWDAGYVYPDPTPLEAENSSSP